jgi:hypothetical protein
LFKLNALPGKALAVARIRFERLRYSGHRGERAAEQLPLAGSARCEEQSCV